MARCGTLEVLRTGYERYLAESGIIWMREGNEIYVRSAVFLALKVRP